MVVVNTKKLLIITFLGLSFSLVSTDVSRAETQNLKNTITELTNKRDADIATLVGQRNMKVRTLENELIQKMQGKIAKIKKDKESQERRRKAAVIATSIGRRLSAHASEDPRFRPGVFFCSRVG